MRPRFFHVFFAMAAAMPTGAFLHSAPWLDPEAPDVKTILCSEDNQFSCYESPGKQTEWLLNFGGAPQTRLKGAQDISAFKFDLAAFRGQTVAEAELHLAKGDTIPIFALVAATINAPWSEGRRTGAPAAPGESCWRWRAMPADLKNPGDGAEWLFPHSDFSMATFGNYGSLVSYGYKASGTFDVSSKGGATWMRMRLDPALAHALIGDQYGLAVTDPRGYNHTNPRVFTKDQNKSVCPRLVLRLAPQKDSTPPGAVAGLRGEAGPLDGEVILSFTAPEDPQAADKRAFGYGVRVGANTDFNAAVEAPRWRIPRPLAPGAAQRMLLDALKPGVAYNFFIRAYDAAGNMGPIASVSFTISVRPAPTLTDGERKAPSASGQPAPAIPGVLRYWACSEVAKINPATGNRIEDGSAGSDGDAYRKANAVWDAAANTIHLAAARNEMVGCQIILEKLGASLTNIHIMPGDLERALSSKKNSPAGLSRDSAATDRPGRIAANPNAECFLIHYVAEKSARYPDAAIPLAAPFPTSFSIPDPMHNPSGANQAVWVDWYIPKDVAPGEYQGEIIITAAELPAPAKVKMALRVHPVTIPDALSFIIDLNGYGSKWEYGNMKLNRLRWFQACQKHRMSLNTLPYGWNAKVASDRAPQVAGGGANVKLNDWSALDADYGPFFDGSAFTPKTAGSPYFGPGAGTPVATFYTPFFESWPVPVLDPQCGFDSAGKGGAAWRKLMDTNPNAFWVDAPDVRSAFTDNYAKGVRSAVRQWTEHAQAKGWTGTNFQIYLNHKYSYKGCNALWILEECVTADDFRAVGFFHSLFRAGAEEAKAAPAVRWHFRLDISDRWGQNYGQLDNLINWYCINSGSGDWHWPNIRYRNLLLGGGAGGGSQNGGERYVWYGTGPAPQDSGVGHARRFLQAWAQGLDGGVPYWDNFQTNWSKAQALSVVYSGQNVPGFGQYEGPIMSVRVKMMRQAQQIVELANLLAARPGWNRERVAQAIFQKFGDGSWNRGFSGLDEAGIYRLKADLLAAFK